MFNRTPAILIALVATALQAGAQAADAPTPTPVPTAAPHAAPGDSQDAVLATKPLAPAEASSDSDGVSRSVSAGVAAALSEGMPKYTPVTPTPVVNQPKDLRDIDKPKNEIPRLPSYVVHASRPPVFRERDLYTPEGLVSLSYKLHPGLAVGNILGMNDAAAELLYQQDQRLANISDLTDEAHAMARGGDKGESAYILQETQDTYMQPAQDWTWGGPGGGISGDGVK